MPIYPRKPIIVKRGEPCEFGIAMTDSVTGEPNFDAEVTISVSKNGGRYELSDGTVRSMPPEMRGPALTDSHFVRLTGSDTDAGFVGVRASARGCDDLFRNIDPIQ